jgi:hypothetical protein
VRKCHTMLSMLKLGAQTFRLFSTALMLLLVTAQARALTHVYAHDADTYQDSICASCVTSGQLSSVCVPASASLDLDCRSSIPDVGRRLCVNSMRLLHPRQRGPPDST